MLTAASEHVAEIVGVGPRSCRGNVLARVEWDPSDRSARVQTLEDGTSIIRGYAPSCLYPSEDAAHMQMLDVIKRGFTYQELDYIATPPGSFTSGRQINWKQRPSSAALLRDPDYRPQRHSFKLGRAPGLVNDVVAYAAGLCAASCKQPFMAAHVHVLGRTEHEMRSTSVDQRPRIGTPVTVYDAGSEETVSEETACDDDLRDKVFALIERMRAVSLVLPRRRGSTGFVSQIEEEIMVVFSGQARAWPASSSASEHSLPDLHTCTSCRRRCYNKWPKMNATCLCWTEGMTVLRLSYAALTNGSQASR